MSFVATSAPICAAPVIDTCAPAVVVQTMAAQTTTVGAVSTVVGYNGAWFGGAMPPLRLGRSWRKRYQYGLGAPYGGAYGAAPYW